MVSMSEDAAVDRAVETFTFLGDRNRLRILTILARSETCVCDLINELELAKPLVSYHLAKLRKAGLLHARRDAQWIYYSLDPVAWRELIAPMESVLPAESLPLAASYGASRRCDTMPPDPAHGSRPTNGVEGR